jgi:hypothetical protein
LAWAEYKTGADSVLMALRKQTAGEATVGVDLALNRPIPTANRRRAAGRIAAAARDAIVVFGVCINQRNEKDV